MSGELWPLAGEVARAIVAACALDGDDPIDVAQGGYAPRSRIYAFVAIAAEFREIDRQGLARLVGWQRPNLFAGQARAAVRGLSGLRWFDLDQLNSVRRSVGWRDLTLDEAASAPLQSDRKRREAFERGRKRVREKNDRRQRKFDHLEKWQPGELAGGISPPRAPSLADVEAIPSRELTITTEHALGGRLVDVTAALCGDPPPERSALNNPREQAAGRRRISPMPTRELRHPDEVFVERWMAGQARKQNEAAAAQEGGRETE